MKRVDEARHVSSSVQEVMAQTQGLTSQEQLQIIAALAGRLANERLD